MIKIAICDDDKLHREHTMALVAEYAELRSDSGIVFSSFLSGDRLLNAVGSHGLFDMYILDVVMPNMSGIELGLALRRQDTEGKIIYLSSASEYAVHSYPARAYYYLLKPVEKEKLFAVMDSAIAEIRERKNKSTMVKTGDETLKISFDDILYVELFRRSLIFHLTDGSVVKSVTVRIPFAEAIEKLMQDERFFMCGASLAINLYHVTAVEKDAVVFQKKQRIYTPKSACAAIRSHWLDFWLKNGMGGKI